MPKQYRNQNLNYNTKNDGQNVGENVGENVGQNVGQNVAKKLKPADRRKQILKIISLNPKYTAYDLSKNFGVVERTIQRDLKFLTEANLIKYVGSAKDGYWKILNEDIK